MRWTITRKMALLFGGLLLLVIATGFVGHRATSVVGDDGVEAGVKLAPLAEAAMEIKLGATRAHLLFEEIMAGDEGESIDEVWQLLDQARFHVTAILEGGKADGRTYYPSESEAVREKITKVGKDLEIFTAAARERYAYRALAQGSGTNPDEVYDTLSDDLTRRIAALAEEPAFAGNADAQRRIGAGRFHLAEAHWLIAEILGGDDDEDFGKVTGNLAAAQEAVAGLGAAPSADIAAVTDDLGRLIAVAKERYAKRNLVGTAGSDADEAFDQTYEALMDDADAAEAVIHKHIDAKMENLRQETVTASIVMAAIALLTIAFGIFAYVFAARTISYRICRIAKVTNALASGDASADIPDWSSRDEIGDLTASVRVFKDNLIERQRLQGEQAAMREKAEEEKRVAMAELADDFERNVGTIADAVSKAVSDLQSASRTMTSSSEETSGKAASVSRLSDETNGNVQSVASATEELASSVQEVGRQVAQSSEMSTRAVGEAQATVDRVNALSSAASRIGDIITLIQDIAEQTNLLALNATIEAARAGEAGKGFAVVASEVKTLAEQTAKATTEISEQIGEIQSTTSQSSEAIGTISSTITNLNDIASAIAAAVDEQSAATQEIARSVNQAAEGTLAVTDAVGDIRNMATSTTSSSGKVLSSAEALAGQADRLRAEMETFLKQVRSA
ncbi:methyl-accepting chemotaxis protein [Rhodobium orientis]|uniref:Methyl-accepting chemotaxis protein n=1 Tax=Rhodobium orientis TaxID=34017 RepID=A0A327JPA1_9HYPH|nr:HAMP domain-containing methyl-accepting chemotaxis protein [Rhodobium orientis]MBB4305372.1 methyl-accepting chemotaxis protein [Rhodobium orientis]MBK5950094.1 hypothetical protein [Rhodobium orientis]RAI25238.1 hypothetical protein CH339_19010 [Rhodobium orientis]